MTLVLKQDSWFYSHWGHCSLGGTLRCLLWHLPQVFVYHLLSINYIPFLLQTSYNDRLHLLFSRGRQVGEGDGLNVGESPSTPTTTVHIPSLTPAELSSLTSLKAWGEKQRICHNITFLLVLAEEEATGDKKYGISTIWVNPCQASGPNWPYALVQFHEDTHHVPLPKEGHLGILPQRGAETTPCGRISQLEVCQLLISGWQVA